MARDLFHNVVKQSLQAEGWAITHDPFPGDYGDVQLTMNFLGCDSLKKLSKINKFFF